MKLPGPAEYHEANGGLETARVKPDRSHLVPVCELPELWEHPYAQLVRESEGVGIRVRDIPATQRAALNVGRVDWNLKDDDTYCVAMEVLINRLGHIGDFSGGGHPGTFGLLKKALEATSDKSWVWR